MIKATKKDLSILIIAGPTASGKTALSEKIANSLTCEIINADVGQFYKPLSIGTAKPDWENQAVKHHLFDIIDQPEDLSVFKYRKLVLDKATQIWEQGKLPIVVGGSLFYLKSLFFPPQELEHKQESNKDKMENDDGDLWEILNKIDPERAKKIHPNDVYRIRRALEIWEKTGIKPSEHKPKYDPQFHSFFVFLSLDKAEINKRIDLRTEEMIKAGWFEETKALIKTKWEDFLKRKGLIGYPEILKWIEDGEKKEKLPDLIKGIQQKTRLYAKRQRIFWKSLKPLLEENNLKAKFLCKIIEVDNSGQTACLAIKEQLNKHFQLDENKNFCFCFGVSNFFIYLERL